MVIRKVIINHIGAYNGIVLPVRRPIGVVGLELCCLLLKNAHIDFWIEFVGLTKEYLFPRTLFREVRPLTADIHLGLLKDIEGHQTNPFKKPNLDAISVNLPVIIKMPIIIRIAPLIFWIRPKYFFILENTLMNPFMANVVSKNGIPKPAE
jgi:hypothetical protein